MEKFFEALSHYINEHWMKAVVAAVFIGIGWYFGQRRSRIQWEKKEFLDRLNISLNTIHEGKLLIRTLVEKPCDEIFLNSVAVKQLLAAAPNTTQDDSLIPLENDYWYFLNSVLNEVSERFALGLMKRDLGEPVASEPYLICLTNESDGEIRTRKIRAMVIRKQLLTNLPQEKPVFESPNHATRWRTLRQLATSYEADPRKFLEMEICV